MQPIGVDVPDHVGVEHREGVGVERAHVVLLGVVDGLSAGRPALCSVTQRGAQPGRLNARQVVGAGAAAHDVREYATGPGRCARAPVELELRAVEFGIALHEVGDGQAVFQRARFLEEHVVGDVVVIDARLEVEAIRVHVIADVDVRGHFQLGIAAVGEQADLEQARGEMGPVRVELGGVGVAFRA